MSRNPRFNYTFGDRICPPFGYIKLLYLCVKSLRDIKLKSASYIPLRLRMSPSLFSIF
ncbi:hypothetical protein ENHYDAX1_60130 [Enhydrobacter sp. AX1]|nr:hypothetical protein ENHYDAX1_60130 [Enhydrobacter sp. AX1]